MQSLHLYFLGKAQGIYLAADTFPKLVTKAQLAIVDCDSDYREFIETALAHIRKERRKGYSAISSEYGAKGVQWSNEYPDRFNLELNARCADLGQFPGMNYHLGECV